MSIREFYQSKKPQISVAITTIVIFPLVFLLAACGDNTNKPPEDDMQPSKPHYTIQLEFDCIKNLIFSKYDLDILIDSDKIGKLDHGATRTYSVELEEGTHTLVVRKEGSSSVDGTIDLVVSEDAEHKYKLHCTSQQVEIEEIVEDGDEIISNNLESNDVESETENTDISDNIKTSLRTVSCFNPETNQELVFGGLKFSFPAHFDTLEEGATETKVHYYPSEEICYCSLVFFQEDTDLSQIVFDNYKSSIADNYLKSMREREGMKITEVTSEEMTVAGLSGWTISFVAFHSDNTQSMVNYTYIFNPENNKIVYVLQTYGDNDQSNYDYVGDYKKILQNMSIDDEQNSQTTTTPGVNDSNSDSPDETQANRELSYTTNDRATAKKGNSGVFSYQKSGKNYDIYWIIDFDGGYAYYFTEGNGNSICDRVAIESGDLNDVMVVTYHDGDDEWSYGLHFKWKNLPDILVMQDNDGFEYDFATTSLDNALKIRDSKTIKDY